MPSIANYIIKKLLIGIIVVIAITFILFLIFYFTPGDPVTLLLGGERVSMEKIAEIKREWGLDKPFYLQYFYWLTHILRGDFGISITTKMPVSILFSERLPYTLELTLTSLLLSYVIGVVLGTVAAIYKNSLYDNFITLLSVIFYSTPSYWLGLLLMLIFGLYLKILPLSGAFSFSSLFLPVATLTLSYLAMFVRLVKTDLIEALNEDYVRTAFAKGLDRNTVVFRHALRNALIPATVMFFLQFPWIIGGAVVVEVVFAWPGMGTLLYNAILSKDYMVVEAIVFAIAILTIISNLLGDIVSAILDPRIRIGRSE